MTLQLNCKLLAKIQRIINERGVNIGSRLLYLIVLILHVKKLKNKTSTKKLKRLRLRKKKKKKGGSGNSLREKQLQIKQRHTNQVGPLVPEHYVEVFESHK